MSNAAPSERGELAVDAANARGSRVLFFGRHCRLSAVPLRALIDAGANLVGVVVPAPPRPGPHATPIRRREPRRGPTLPLAGKAHGPALDSLAAEVAAPMFEVTDLRATATRHALAETAPDVIAVSCFPLWIPPEVRSLATRGAVNVHPSLLPRHRGPDPLFWVYRCGDTHTGVTVHLLTDRLDAGDIVAQHTIPVEPGLPGDVLEARCAEVGADLLVQVVAQAAIGALRPRPQPTTGASYEGWPEEDDLKIDPEWTCTRAWHFARGILPLGYQPWFTDGRRTFIISHVTGVRPGIFVGELVQRGPRGAAIQLADGVLDAEITEGGNDR